MQKSNNHIIWSLEYIISLFVEKFGIIALSILDFSTSVFISGKHPIRFWCRNCHKPIDIKQAYNVARSEKYICPHCRIDRSGCDRFYRGQQEFLERSYHYHKNRYDYTYVFYKDYYSFVDIFCRIHGFFKQRAGMHMNGMNCPKCGNISGSEKRTISQEEFERRSNIRHNNFYIYKNSIYTGYDDPINIECPIHKMFTIARAGKHMSADGYACIDCAKKCQIESQRLTKEQFIDRSNARFGDLLNYDKTKYVDYSTPVILNCQIHGDFVRTPDSHLKCKYACNECATIQRGFKKRKSLEQLCDESEELFGKVFDFSKSVYNGSKKEILIICGIHKEFITTPDNHLGSKYGCAQCGHSAANEDNKLTKDKFIDNAMAIHGKTFSYTNAIYVDYHTKLEITCYNHGSFWQTPASHIRGNGCPICKSSHMENIMFHILREAKVPFTPEFSIPSLPNRAFDYYILLAKFKIINELDGIHHFREVPFFKRSLAEVQAIDIEKTVAAIKEGYCVIRIDYTLNSISNIEQHLIAAIEHFEKGNCLYLSTPSMYDWLTKGMEKYV